MSNEERVKVIKEAIFEGELSEAKNAMRQAMEDDIDPAVILRDAIMPAIKEIGMSMEEGDFFMPEVKMSTKVLQEVAEIFRPCVIPEKEMASYKAPPWVGEGDIDDIGTFLKTTVEGAMGLSVQEQMGIMDMIATGLDTHEFTPCKIQATETKDD
ncbi:MAG: B12-binding domain-containing protein [Desulfobacteraceae bacterium]|nr:MAG: B12-binding domain-containing protein [Desulfobacteraceae bacterium]